MISNCVQLENIYVSRCLSQLFTAAFCQRFDFIESVVVVVVVVFLCVFVLHNGLNRNFDFLIMYIFVRQLTPFGNKMERFQNNHLHGAQLENRSPDIMKYCHVSIYSWNITVALTLFVHYYFYFKYAYYMHICIHMCIRVHISTKHINELFYDLSTP